MTKEDFKALFYGAKIYSVIENVDGDGWIVIESKLASHAPLPEYNRCSIRLEGPHYRGYRLNMHTLLRDFALTPDGAVAQLLVKLAGEIGAAQNKLAWANRKYTEAQTWAEKRKEKQA